MPTVPYLDPIEWQRMLADIAQVALAIARDLYPETTLVDGDIPVGEASARQDICPRERLGFIASFWPKLAVALRRIEAEPPTALRRGTREVPTERARRVSPKDLLAAVRQGDFVSAPMEASPLALRLGGRLPRRMAEQIAEPNADTPANRMVKAVLSTFVRDLGMIADLATVTGYPDIVAEAFRLRLAVRQALRRTPWRTLPPPAVIPLLPPSLRTHGPYRLFWTVWQRYRQGFAFDWENPLFTLPPREGWLIYEYWCLFQTARVLRSLGYRVTSTDTFALSRSGLTFHLAWGRASTMSFRTLGGKRLTLTYSREIAPGVSKKRRTGDLYASSHAMRPDMFIETDQRLIVLDAKYKTYIPPTYRGLGPPEQGPEPEEAANLPLTADINQMHAYRDGIRRATEDSSAARPVRSAWLLYVGQRDAVNIPVFSYPPSTPDLPFGTGEVGAILLRPGRDMAMFRSFLAGVLGTMRTDRPPVAQDEL